MEKRNYLAFETKTNLVTSQGICDAGFPYKSKERSAQQTSGQFAGILLTKDDRSPIMRTIHV